MPVVLQLYSLGRAADSGIGGHGVIGVEIHNEQPTKLPVQTLQTLPTDYWQPSYAKVPAVHPYQTRRVCILVCGRADAQANDVPQDIDFRLTESNLQLRCRLSFSFFSTSLEQWSPAGLPGAARSPTFNLVLVGAACAAKSSFINSALTLGSPSGKQRVAGENTSLVLVTAD